MTKIYFIVFASLFIFSSCNFQKPKSRVSVQINSNWTFNYLPNQNSNDTIVEPGFDDSGWKAIGLPHTWQTYETTGEVHPFIKNASERDEPYWWKGWGYYRKRFIVAENQMDKLVSIEFDGVQKYSQVFLNGEYIGDHKGGFTSFYFDLTPNIKFGQENVLVVLVSNRRDDKYRIPPMTAGNWDVYGGIYRDVRLVFKNKIHIPYQGSYQHEGGTFITTPQVNEKEAVAQIKTFVKNGSEEKSTVLLKTTLISPQGKKMEQLEQFADVSPGEIHEFTQTSPPIKNPQLWHPNTPSMYHVKSEVFVNGKLVDEIESPLGFRWFHWDYEKNDLYINNKKIQIKGFNRHQEYPWLGDAIPKWLTLKDFADMKENLGINFFRAAHYPNDQQVYRLADSLGMVAVEEVPNIKSIDFSEEVQEQNVREMIRRDRNHPSIFFWSVGNETNDAADSKWVVEEDTTRIIHARKCENAGDFVQHDHVNLDMENLLRVSIRGYFDDDNAPTDRDLKPEDGQYCSLEEWQHERAMMENGSVRGSLKKNTVLWLYEDHGADREYKNSPLKHINYKGWVDLYRIPKYTYYLTQAMFTETPMVFVHPHNWTPKYLGQNKDFIVNSNCEKVELFFNNEKLAEAFPSFETYFTVTFENIPVKNGTLKVVGTKGDTKVENVVVLSGGAHKLKLTVSDTKIGAGLNDVAIVTADITDEYGNRVIMANNPITWEVTGAATLVGPADYKTDFDLFESMEGTGYIRVPVCNVIRSSNRPGKATVTVRSPGLEPASVEIEVAPANLDNKLVVQPVLKNDPSVKIKKIVNYISTIKKETELKPVSGNTKFDIADKTKLREDFTRFLIKNNPKFDKDLIESKVLIDYFADYLTRMKGDFIGDDFNFVANAYNDCRYIAKAVDAADFRYEVVAPLVQEYASRMIKKGELVDVDAEANMYLNLPKKNLTVKWEEEPVTEDPWISKRESGGTTTFYTTSFEKLCELAYPSLKTKTAEECKAYFHLVDTVNPFLKMINGKLVMEEGGFYCIVNPEKTQNK